MTDDLTSAPRPRVVVTGAAQGLGAAICRTLAAAGYGVTGVDLAADALSALIAELGEGHLAIAGDIADPAVMADACRRAAGPDGLAGIVLNAGISIPDRSDTMPLDHWDRTMSVNLRGTMVGAQAARPFLRAGSGVVMLSSIAASQGLAERAAYCASKAGVDGLVRALAVEWAPDGIRVNAVAPGSFFTSMQAKLIEKGWARIDRYVARIPMGRQGQPEELAAAVSFLISPAASYITGVVLPVDGGWAAFGLPSEEGR